MKTIALALTLVALARPGLAQDPRLERLAPDARSMVATLIDSARAAGVPVEPLVLRALEGTSKGAPASLIAAALRRLAGDLGRAREALGPAAEPAELAAAADALRAGASAGVLLRLREALGARQLAVPLGVTADLTTQGVPADSAATLVIGLAQSVADAELLALQRDVERDIALGASPLAAASGRFTNVDAATPTSVSGQPTSAPAVRRKP